MRSHHTEGFLHHCLGSRVNPGSISDVWKTRNGPGVFQPPWSQLTCSLSRPTWSPRGGQHSCLSLGVPLVTLGVTSRPTTPMGCLHVAIPRSVPPPPRRVSRDQTQVPTIDSPADSPSKAWGIVQSALFYNVPHHHPQKHYLFHSPGLIPSMSFLSEEQESGGRCVFR